MKSLTFFKLMNSVGLDPRLVEQYSIYDDGEYHDHIAKLGSSYVNFCRITPSNRARYQVLLALDQWLARNPTELFQPPEVRLLECEGEEWYYERIDYYDTVLPLSYEQCMILDQRQRQFNQHCEKFAETVSEPLRRDYNRAIGFYLQHTDLELPENTLHLMYGDWVRTIDCHRIGFGAKGYVFTGYQAFLFYHPTVNPATLLLMSMIKDTQSQREHKIAKMSPAQLKECRALIRGRFAKEWELHSECIDFYRNTGDYLGELGRLLDA